MPSPAESAAARVSFQLTYARAALRREFRPGELTGPDIPCAYGGDLDQDGGWNHDSDLIDGGWEDGGDHSTVFADRDEAGWIDRYANYAINEAVHEALEWLKVDGRPWLDPHGPAESEVYAAVTDLVDRLAVIRAKRLTT